MMSVTHNVTLDVDKRRFCYEQAVHVRVGDKATQTVTAALTKNGASYSPPSGSTAKIEVLKHDNTWSVSSATISGSSVSGVLPLEAMSCPGECKRAYFRITNSAGTQEDTTEDFYLYVFPNATQDAIESRPYTDQLDELIAAASEELQDTIDEVRDIRNGADGRTYDRAGDAIRATVIVERSQNINTAEVGRWAISGSTGQIRVGSVTNFGMASKVPCNPSTEYTITIRGIVPMAGSMYWATYDEDGAFIGITTESNTTTATVTTPANARFICVYQYRGGDGIGNIDDGTIQIEEGGTSTEYAPPISMVDYVARSAADAVASEVDERVSPIELSVNPLADLRWNDGYIGSNGRIQPQGADVQYYSDPIDVAHVMSVELHEVHAAVHYLWAAVCTYDDAGAFIARTQVYHYTKAEGRGTFDIPDGVRSIRVTYNSFGDTTLFEVRKLVDAASTAEAVGVLEDAAGGRSDSANTIVASNPLRFYRYWDHLFIDKVNQASQLIPNQSLANVETARRLGFNCIEVNTHPTSDGVFICIHGQNGAFGKQVKHVDGETDISATKINTVTYEWVLQNVRNRSTVEKYILPPPRVEEMLYACRRNNIVPLISNATTALIDIVDGIMGKNNYFAYNSSRSTTSAPIMRYASFANKQEVMDYCDTYGPPFMVMIANPGDFTDAELADIVHDVHDAGYWISYAACYLTESENQRLMGLGFDAAPSAWGIEDFGDGNMADIHADSDFSGFTTTGTVSGGVLSLADGQTVAPGTLAAKFLAGGSLHVRFSGTIELTFGHRIAGERFTSDGVQEMWFSTYFMNASPTFSIASVGQTDILDLHYAASEF